MYQALYRQYRPKTFNEVLGQEHIIRTLRQQVLTGNIGHAYLFSGTRGTGKTSIAKILSRAVNCLNPKDGNPCNECEICRGIIDESIMDVIEMDAASNNSVDDVRDLKDKVIYPPSRTKYKVYIIDEVHMLSKGAFNALLKTLEEPPKHLIFILATTEPERLPQTILSRCQRFDFKRITNKDIVENMRSITNKLEISIEDKALNLIARNSDGAMRDALSLLDQCISYNSNNISYKDATNILGIANRDLLFNLVNDIKNKNLEGVLFSIDEIIQNGKDINQFIKDLIRHFRDLMIAKTSKNPIEIIETENVEEYIEQCKTISLQYILKALDVLNTAETQGKWSTQPRIILEMAAIKLINIEEELTLEERIKRLEQGIKPIPATDHVKPVVQVDKIVNKHDVIEEQQREPEEVKISYEMSNSDGSDLSLDKIVKEWPKVMQTIKSKKINIYALIMEGKTVSYENNLLTIAYDEGFGFHKEAVSSKQNKEFVEDLVSKHFNKKINIHFYMQEELGKGIGKDPVNDKEEAIKQVIDLFGKDIVEIE
jgi:DNA polymerase-3 subunit gamma/tau